MEVTNCIKEVFSEKNIKYYKYYLQNYHLERKLKNQFFFLYLIDALLFDIKVKNETKVEESHFYKALKLLFNYP